MENQGDWHSSHNIGFASHKIPSDDFCSPVCHQDGLFYFDLFSLHYEFTAISSFVCAHFKVNCHFNQLNSQPR